MQSSAACAKVALNLWLSHQSHYVLLGALFSACRAQQSAEINHFSLLAPVSRLCPRYSVAARHSKVAVSGEQHISAAPVHTRRESKILKIV